MPLAEFSMEGRVLSKQRYFFGRESQLAPVDLALGWGPMSNYQVLKNLKISQSDRWCHYSYDEAPIVPSEIDNHSANMHLIPANAEIKRKIEKVRRGEIVAFKGALVQVSDLKGWNWVSSLSRSDTGDGACEVVWVEDFTIK